MKKVLFSDGDFHASNLVWYDLGMECEQWAQVCAKTITLDGLGFCARWLKFLGYNMELQKDEWCKI